MISTGIAVALAGVCAEITPFLIRSASFPTGTASVYGIMASCPHLPRRKEVASTAKEGGSPIGSQYEPAR